MPSVDTDAPPLTATVLPPFLLAQDVAIVIAIAHATALKIDMKLFFIVVLISFLFVLNKKMNDCVVLSLKTGAKIHFKIH